LFCKFKENKKEAAVNALKGGQPLPSQLWGSQPPSNGEGWSTKKKKKKKKKKTLRGGLQPEASYESG
jgi:hypothetical protein